MDATLKTPDQDLAALEYTLQNWRWRYDNPSALNVAMDRCEELGDLKRRAQLLLAHGRQWDEAFKFAGQDKSEERGKSCVERCTPDDPVREDYFTTSDVAHVIAYDEGENDGPNWIIAGKLDDGRYFFLSAGCDYTGWD